ncbi:hypothetical protein [Candidatus Electrothrix sp.]|uniref:hypothetical protein n=1 Tax=Candidatus Electrothrix sp. TaxID=2170559 RepID=UPI004056D8D0
MAITEIFLSRCSEEFKKESEVISNHYNDKRREYKITAQENLVIQSYTLEKLQNIIKEAEFVIHLIGDNPGTGVGKNKIEEFRRGAGDWLDKGQSEICHQLRKSEDFWDEITYTEWEAYIALHFGAELFCFDLRREKDNGSSQCKRHLKRLYHAGDIHPTCCDREELLTNFSACLASLSNDKKKPSKVTTIKLNDPCLPPCLSIMGAMDFVGRKNYLSYLDTSVKNAIENNTRIIQLVAQGGTGKTKLVARWIHSRRMALSSPTPHIPLSENYLKLFKHKSVLGYSLYSQGTGKNALKGSGAAAVEEPIWKDAVNKWFIGDEKARGKLNETIKEPSEYKADILADILINRKDLTLLILDGLEAALRLSETDDGETKWIVRDAFLRTFLKCFVEAESSQCILVVTTRVEMALASSEHGEGISPEFGERILTERIKPLGFEKTNIPKKKNYNKKISEAAKVLYYYVKRKPGATRILAEASSEDKIELQGKKAETIRDALLENHKDKIPANDHDLRKNLEKTARNLRGHALSLKLAGQLIANTDYGWGYVTQNFDPKRHRSTETADDTEFANTINRVNNLLLPHIETFRDNYPHRLKALLAVGVFDREASFEEIEHAATYLDNLRGCSLGSSESKELESALIDLAGDGFLTLYDAKKKEIEDDSCSVPSDSGTEDAPNLWDCHPLIRSKLCDYIFDKDEEDASRCHHEVAYFYLSKLSETWKESILTDLHPETASQNGFADIGSDDAKEERARRKDTWRKQDRKQALADMGLLQRAVYHFILAKELRNAWHLYWEWMSVHKEYLFSRFLGKFEEDLSTLSHFFESPWTSIKQAKEKGQVLSSLDIASLFNAAGFRLRSLSRLTEAHQASGGSFLKWQKAGWNLNDNLSEDEKNNFRESSYAAGNRAEYSMVQASLADALMYADLAVRLADKSEDPKARFIHRVELAEILWLRGNTDQAIEQLEWVDNEDNIKFPPEETISVGNNDIPPRLWAELYCLYQYRFGKVLIDQNKENIEKALALAFQLIHNAKKTNWILNRWLGKLLLGYIELAKAESTCQPFCPSRTCLEEARKYFTEAKKEFRGISAGHHVMKARLGIILCDYKIGNNFNKASDALSELSLTAGERHLFRIDAEVERARVLMEEASTDSNQKDATERQVERVKSLCIKAGYLRHLPLLDSLSPKEG